MISRTARYQWRTLDQCFLVSRMNFSQEYSVNYQLAACGFERGDARTQYRGLLSRISPPFTVLFAPVREYPAGRESARRGALARPAASGDLGVPARRGAARRSDARSRAVPASCEKARRDSHSLFAIRDRR